MRCICISTYIVKCLRIEILNMIKRSQTIQNCENVCLVYFLYHNYEKTKPRYNSLHVTDKFGKSRVRSIADK